MSILRMAIESMSFTSLNGFKVIKPTKENIDKYKENYKGLRHVDSGDRFDGVMLVDKDVFVAVLQINIQTSFIQALEVNEEYRNKGIASKLLDIAYKNFNCKTLTVNKKNENAIRLYKNKGYKVYDETEHMYYMRRD